DTLRCVLSTIALRTSSSGSSPSDTRRRAMPVRPASDGCGCDDITYVTLSPYVVESTAVWRSGHPLPALRSDRVMQRTSRQPRQAWRGPRMARGIDKQESNRIGTPCDRTASWVSPGFPGSELRRAQLIPRNIAFVQLQQLIEGHGNESFPVLGGHVIASQGLDHLGCGGEAVTNHSADDSQQLVAIAQAQWIGFGQRLLDQGVAAARAFVGPGKNIAQQFDAVEFIHGQRAIDIRGLG